MDHVFYHVRNANDPSKYEAHDAFVLGESRGHAHPGLTGLLVADPAHGLQLVWAKPGDLPGQFSESETRKLSSPAAYVYDPNKSAAENEAAYNAAQEAAMQFDVKVGAPFGTNYPPATDQPAAYEWNPNLSAEENEAAREAAIEAADEYEASAVSRSGNPADYPNNYPADNPNNYPADNPPGRLPARATRPTSARGTIDNPAPVSNTDPTRNPAPARTTRTSANPNTRNRR